MDLFKKYKENSHLNNSFKSRDFTKGFFKEKNRDFIKKDELYTIQTNMKDMIGKWHILSCFYVFNTTPSYIEAINLLYIPEEVLLKHIKNGFNKNEFLTNHSYSIVKIPLSNIIFCTLKNFSDFSLIPYLNRSILGIDNNIKLKNDIKKLSRNEYYAIRRKQNQVKAVKNAEINKHDDVETETELHYDTVVDLDFLFDNGTIKIID